VKNYDVADEFSLFAFGQQNLEWAFSFPAFSLVFMTEQGFAS
jgi:hypothetical protein